MAPHAGVDSPFARLKVTFPNAATQLDELSNHLIARGERISALIRFLAAHSELPMTAIFIRYSRGWDRLTFAPLSDPTEQECAAIPGLSSAIGKRLRIVRAAGELILKQGCDWTVPQVAMNTMTTELAIRRLFGGHDGLFVAACDHLMEKASV